LSIHGNHPQAPAARVYISGPISGMKNGNRSAFAASARLVEECGHIAVNPTTLDHEHSGRCRGGDTVRHPQDLAPESHQYGCYMRADLEALLTCDLILLLPGWTDSRGAMVEYKVSEAIGLEAIYPAMHVPGVLRRWREFELLRSATYARPTEHGIPMPSLDHRNPLTTLEGTAQAGEFQ
jgi:hypothetical protein